MGNPTKVSSEASDGPSGQLRRLQLTGGKIRYSDGRGQLDIFVPTSSLILFRFEGHAVSGFDAAQIEVADRALARAGQLVIFSDWSGMTGYEGTVRKSLTEWAAKHVHQVVFHCLIRSPILAMGLEVAKLTSGGEIHSYATKRPFDQAFERALGSPFNRTTGF